jgi:nucleoside-diphosphate-sugar epimerase
LASLIEIEQPKRPRVLVTGLSGFTGGYVRDELLEAGYEVVGGDVTRAVTAGERALDITSIDQCRRAIDQTRPSHIIHMAASSFVADADTLDMYRVNVLGTLNLLQACQDCGHVPEKVLIASSANVYGNTAGIVDENVPPAPVNHYAASKVAMEHLVRTWFDRLPIIITRPFNYTGRGQSERFLVPKIVSRFANRCPDIELGNLNVARDFSDVRFVARVYRALLETDVASEVINVCSERPYTLREIVEIAGQVSGHELQIRVNQSFVRANEVSMLAGKSEKLRRLVSGLSPTPFVETMRWMMLGERAAKSASATN